MSRINTENRHSGERRFSDTELETLIKNKRYIFVFANVYVVLAVVLLIPVVFFINIGTAIFGACTILPVIYLGNKAKRDMKTLLADYIINSVLGEVFSEFVYKPFERISNSCIRQNDMYFPFSFNEIDGGDYIRGVYKGLNIEMSDLRLIRVIRHKKRTTRETVFRGTWLTCDFEKELSADLCVSERTAFGKMMTMGGVKTESVEFNKKFYIRTENEHEAFYILTPHMMEYILAMDTKANADTYIRFAREGKLHLAINSDRDSFELGFSNINLKELREKFLLEIKGTLDLIDELRMVDTLYKEKV